MSTRRPRLDLDYFGAGLWWRTREQAFKAILAKATEALALGDGPDSLVSRCWFCGTEAPAEPVAFVLDYWLVSSSWSSPTVRDWTLVVCRPCHENPLTHEVRDPWKYAQRWRNEPC